MCPSTHAEVNALKQLIDGRRDRTCKRMRVNMTILRKTHKNEYAISKPCKHCIQMMKSRLISQFINIRDITYFDGNDFVTEPLDAINDEYVSSGWHHYYNGY